MIAAVDIPSWVNAGSAALGVAVSAIALVVSVRAKTVVGKIVPDYALVGSDGRVMRHSGFGDFHLNVELDEVAVAPDRTEITVPEYTLTFRTLPAYFEVTTMQGAVVRLVQSGPESFKLRFVAAGYGDPVVKSSFKIQAY